MTLGRTTLADEVELAADVDRGLRRPGPRRGDRAV